MMTTSFMAWQLGLAKSPEIGEEFGLTYSTVSPWLGAAQEMLNHDKPKLGKNQRVKSLIKI